MKVCSDSIFGLYVLDSRPSPEFNFEAAKNKLINLDLAFNHSPQMVFSTPGDNVIGNTAFGQDHVESEVGRHGKLMRLAGWIDLDSRLTVCYTLHLLLEVLFLINWPISR